MSARRRLLAQELRFQYQLSEAIAMWTRPAIPEGRHTASAPRQSLATRTRLIHPLLRAEEVISFRQT